MVEDEIEIRELMALHLLRQGFKVVECAHPLEAQSVLENKVFDLVVLDWMMPGMSGVDFIDVLKAKSPESKILMVTAKTEPQDIVYGLEKGADDYLTKPFDPNIFMARVRALLRRSLISQAHIEDEEVKIAGLSINFKTYEVFVDLEKLHLTPSEFKLLALMVQNQGRVLTREKLIENIQGEGINVVGRTVDTHVFGLRKKLGSWSDHIETIRGVGYRVKLE
ncbi:MAG: response regulator transcription factor [Bdellovibrionaceae bacterium]|nr:response regulator transcription factor [Pseudobdellovibrionaceae bacterium]